MSARILYVEDDQFVAHAARTRLARDGHEVTLSADGKEGLTLAQSGQFDIILLDHMLPGLSGIEILRELEPDEYAPVIMVSGSSELPVAVEAMRIGAADYVIKETDGSFLDLLPQMVDRVLAHVELLRARDAAEVRIREQAATIQGVLDNMDPGVTLFDGDRRLVSINDRVSELFAVSQDAVNIGDSLEAFIETLNDLGEFAADEAASWLEKFQSGESFRLDHSQPNGDTIEVRGGPMPGGGVIATYTDISERKRMEEELRRLATTDPLTGANNRRRFGEVSTRELARCKRYGHPLCVLMLDADHFKSVNDTHGHDVGDKVLVQLSETCRESLRDVDVFGRLGGEEFAVTLPETPLDTAADAAERLRQAIAGIRVPLEDGSDLSFTVSIGIADLRDETTTIEELLNRADAALYTAKQAGRNQVARN